MVISNILCIPHASPPGGIGCFPAKSPLSLKLLYYVQVAWITLYGVADQAVPKQVRYAIRNTFHLGVRHFLPRNTMRF